MEKIKFGGSERYVLGAKRIRSGLSKLGWKWKRGFLIRLEQHIFEFEFSGGRKKSGKWPFLIRLKWSILFWGKKL